MSALPVSVARPEATLSAALESQAVDRAELLREYGPAIEILRRMLGTEPHASRLMAIWPTGFQAQNLIVPNMLDVPGSLFLPGRRLALVGLAMLASSDAVKCGYCTAHSCTFAARRGLDEEQISRLMGRSADRPVTGVERAVVDVAAGMGSVPATLEPEHVWALEQAVGQRKAEWIGLGAAMMGFLNTCMDMLGTPLERSVALDVAPHLQSDLWATRHAVQEDRSVVLPHTVDSFFNLLTWLPHMPGALAMDMRATRGVPSDPLQLAAWLYETVGHSFPVLQSVQAARVRRALGTVLRDQLAPSSLGRTAKHHMAALTGLLLPSPSLVIAAEEMHGDSMPVAPILAVVWVDLADAAVIRAWQHDLERNHGLDPKTSVALMLTIGASESPMRLPEALVDACAEVLSPVEIIEAVVWLGTLRLLHRLDRFVAARETSRRIASGF